MQKSKPETTCSCKDIKLYVHKSATSYHEIIHSITIRNCPLVWMFHSRNLNNRINKIHKRSLRLVYNDNVSSFNELLNTDKSVTIHERNLQELAIEIFKDLNGLSPKFMEEVFSVKRNIKYCSKFIFNSRNIRTVHYGTETISYIGPKLWQMIPSDIRDSKTLQEFKRKIKKWKPDKCLCRLCKTYIKELGFYNLYG